MSNAGALGAVLYEAESSWGEDVTTFATHRIPLLDAVDASGLRHDKIDPQRVVQYLQEGTPWILGPIGGSFKTRIWATGHGSATTGAVTIDAMETLMGYVFGATTVVATTGTTASGGTATAITTAASATFHNPGSGGIFRLGAINDGRGNGQAGVVSAHVTTTLTSKTAFDAAPSGTDAVMPSITFFSPESANAAGTTITGLRFLLLTANYQYECHGCYPMSASLRGTNHGELPYWEIEWGVSWWRYSSSGTFPSTVTSNQYAPAPNAGGSMFFQTYGTATRAKRTYRSLEVNITLGVQPLMGPGGVNAYQTIVGAKRVPSEIAVRWSEDSEAATATPALDGFFTGTDRKHMLVTLNPTNGASVAFYCPNLCITGARPVQTASDRINRIAIEARAYADTAAGADTDMKRSAIRFGYS